MKDLIRYNLQFFAEGEEGATETETAEPSQEVDTDVEQPEENDNAESQEVDQTDTTGEQAEETAAPQSAEDNSRYAAARREAEAQMRQVREAQAQLDSQFAQMFGKYKNPVTGKPITNASEYLQAMQAQERVQMQEKLKSAGVDPEVLDKAIANSPVVQNAQRLQQQYQSQQVQNMVQEDFRKIMSLDPTKTTEQDIINDPSFNEAITYVQGHPGVRLADAYKLVNFDKLTSASNAAAKQAAVNQAKSKSHLKTVNGSSGNDGDSDIPAGELNHWRQMFPDKSNKDLRSLYNKTLRAKGH